MDMPMATTTVMSVTTSPMATATHHHMSMPMGMSTTFSFSTEVTLLFSGWTTNTPAKYFGTLIFVFAITILNRFLGAWRNQLSRKWADESAVARKEHAIRREAKKLEQQRTGGLRGHRKSHSASAARMMDEEKEEMEPLTPALGPDSDEECHVSRSSEEEEEAMLKKIDEATWAPEWTATLGSRWRASNPWRFKIDLPRAVLEGVRAVVGYVLMLAVMTFNVGLFLAIISGIVIGEALLGRYTVGGGWEEGGCHDG